MQQRAGARVHAKQNLRSAQIWPYKRGFPVSHNSVNNTKNSATHVLRALNEVQSNRETIRVDSSKRKHTDRWRSRWETENSNEDCTCKRKLMIIEKLLIVRFGSISLPVRFQTHLKLVSDKHMIHFRQQRSTSTNTAGNVAYTSCYEPYKIQICKNQIQMPGDISTYYSV